MAVLLVYAAALGVAIAVGYAARGRLDSNEPLFLGMMGFASATIIVWLSSMLFNNSSMYDAFWSVAPQTVAIYWAIAASADNRNVDSTRTALILVAVNFWAIRLTTNWMRAFPGLHHEDWRYLNIKRGMLGDSTSVAHKAYYWVCGSLLGIHTFPSLEIFIGSTPSKAMWCWMSCIHSANRARSNDCCLA